MKVRRKFLFIGMALAAVFSCPFFGFVYNSGDDEFGEGWGIFIKPSPNFQFIFKNPAETRYDLVPFNQLDDARKEETRRYCKLRYAVDDMTECYRRMMV
jgi:hypothetical protein